ncbi:MAG: hypothetical protein ACXWNB_12060 [Candidatus Binataceae bacterium]
MDNAEIKIDPFTSGRTAAGLVFAGVGVRIGDFVFPDEKWTDFVIVILSWWAEAVMGLLHGSERTAELRFMEGPYVAELRAGGGPSWRVSFVEDRLKRRVVYETDIERTSFAQSILAEPPSLNPYWPHRTRRSLSAALAVGGQSMQTN